MRIGRDHIASTVYTIAFATAGASLSVLLLISIYNRPMLQVLQTEQFAGEVVRILVGSIGLVLAVPLTTAVGVAVVRASGSGTPVAEPPRAERTTATTGPASADETPRCSPGRSGATSATLRRDRPPRPRPRPPSRTHRAVAGAHDDATTMTTSATSPTCTSRVTPIQVPGPIRAPAAAVRCNRPSGGEFQDRLDPGIGLVPVPDDARAQRFQNQHRPVFGQAGELAAGVTEPNARGGLGRPEAGQIADDVGSPCRATPDGPASAPGEQRPDPAGRWRPARRRHRLPRPSHATGPGNPSRTTRPISGRGWPAPGPRRHRTRSRPPGPADGRPARLRPSRRHLRGEAVPPPAGSHRGTADRGP